MPGFSEQIRELVRSVSNHARRIRRLETLQTPITLSRPSGGHIIQDEGSNLPDQVYLNFEGTGIVAEDDRESGATKITILVGDEFCRVLPLPVGWEIKAGGTYRYLKHSSAFQLTDEGDDRGLHAIDLQIDQGVAADVAAAPDSAILTGYENQIEADCDDAVIIGHRNVIANNSFSVFVLGWGNDIDIDNYGCTILGGAHYVEDSIYCFIGGYDHDVRAGFGCTIFGELNKTRSTEYDYPTYSFIHGIFDFMEGDIYLSFQLGEENYMYSRGGTFNERVLWCGQFGFRNYMQNVKTNYQFGQTLKSFLSDADAAGYYYDGRILLSGDYSKDSPTDGTGVIGGFNQDSWFSQSDVISTWNVAWTTGRFQFPIIPDSIWTFLIYVSATEKGCANSHVWKIEGQIENDGGATTMLVSTVTNIYRDVVTKECQAIADNANDRLAIQFRDTGGPDSTWTNIQISMFTIEVGAEV